MATSNVSLFCLFLCAGSVQASLSSGGCTCDDSCSLHGDSDHDYCNTMDDANCDWTWDYCSKGEAEAAMLDAAGHSAPAALTDSGSVAVDTSAPDCPSCGTSYQLTKDEIGQALTIQNKMRKAVGTPPMAWNCELMCQIQEYADGCEFAHSDSFNAAIPAGENLASGSDGIQAAWMWFSEYGASYPDESATFNCCGHFTAMVWKATKDFGCGYCPDTVYLCQYANDQPNFGGADAFEANVPPFAGTAAQYQAAGLSVADGKAWFGKFSNWGLDVGDALSRFYSVDVGGYHWEQRSWKAGLATGATGMTALLLAMVLVAKVFKASVRRPELDDSQQIPLQDSEQPEE